MFTHNTSDIIRLVAERADLNKVQAEAAVKGLIAIITDSAIQRENVRLHGLGTFKVKDAKARKGRNPKTGEAIDIPARTKVVFAPAKHLKDI